MKACNEQMKSGSRLHSSELLGLFLRGLGGRAVRLRLRPLGHQVVGKARGAMRDGGGAGGLRGMVAVVHGLVDEVIVLASLPLTITLHSVVHLSA